jgi:ABC-type amino acid transport substrate-binding protein
MKKYIFLLHFCFAFCVPQMVFSETLKMAVIDLRPWGFKDDNGNLKGAFIDAGDEIQDLLQRVQKDVEIKKEVMSQSRISTEMSLGRSDFTFAFRSDSLSIDSQPLALLSRVDIVAIPRAGVKLSSYNDLIGKKIGINLNFSVNSTFDKDTRFEKIPVSGYDNLLILLKEKKIDALIANEYQIPYLKKQMKIQKIKTDFIGVPYVVDSREFWAYFSHQSAHQDLKEALKNAIETLENEGNFDRIVNKYTD